MRVNAADWGIDLQDKDELHNCVEIELKIVLSFYHLITKFPLHNLFFFWGNLVFDCLESHLPSFPNPIPSGPVCHALRNREIPTREQAPVTSVDMTTRVQKIKRIKPD